MPTRDPRLVHKKYNESTRHIITIRVNMSLNIKLAAVGRSGRSRAFTKCLGTS